MNDHLRGVNELTLQVRDLDRSVRFYTEVLGLPEIERWQDREVVWVLAGATRIGLWMPQIGIARATPGVGVHYAIQVAPGGYDTVVDRIREAGAEVGEVRWGNGERSAYVTDPDAHVVEFWDHDIRDGSPGPPTAATRGLYRMETLPPI